MNASPQAPALEKVHAGTWKGLLCLSLCVFLVACSKRNSDIATGSQTFDLQNVDAVAKASALARRATPLANPKSEPKPTASPEASKTAMALPEPESRIATSARSIADSAGFQNLPYEEQLSKLRAELVNRIHTLSNYQADSACLILQIIPSESVFDRSIDPRAKLLSYANLVTTVNDLIDIKKAIDNPKG